MRILAVFMNIGFLIFIAVMWYVYGTPKNEHDFLNVCVSTASPIVNLILICLLFPKKGARPFFKQKDLEEQMKIEALTRGSAQSEKDNP